MYFSDNITTIEFTDAVSEFRAAENPPGCRLVGRDVEDPERFGVAEFDESGNLIGIIEKPENPPSSFAIGGIYLFDETFWNRLDAAVEQKGSAMSITDVNCTYVAEGSAKIIDWPDSLWIDCGTPDALFEASQLAAQGKLSAKPCNTRDDDPPLDD